MRLIASLSLALIWSSSVLGQEATQLLTPPGAKQVTDAASYGIGYNIGMEMSAQQLSAEDFNQADLIAGLMDALAGKDPAVSDEVVQAAMEAFGKKVMERAQKLVEAKKAQAAKFLEENKKKDGVQTTQSGLQFQTMKSGSGASPTPDSTVTVHYEGKLLNGEVFDSSIKRGQPASFKVGQVIAGWTEALLRMKVGDKWKLFIPPDLAYGEQGSPPVIGPNETLVFEVELLQVN